MTDPESSSAPQDGKDSSKAASETQQTDWVAEAKSIGLLILAVLGFHSLIAKPFYIPSESMMPVLLKGDRLVVTKYPYGWSYVSASFHLLPEMPGRLFGRTPERGDIVIVQPRGRADDYIKRVIGLPGDQVQMIASQLYINGKPVPREKASDFEIAICPATCWRCGPDR